MTAVWIMLFVCVASSPSCEQGDISVANTSYASSEECYADGMFPDRPAAADSCRTSVSAQLRLTL